MKARKVLRKKFAAAVSLMEVMIGLGILGVVTLIIVPIFSSYFSTAKSLEAKQQLSQVFTMEKTYFYINSKYTNSLTEIGFETQKLTTDGGKARYKIEISDAGSNKFVCRATSVEDFDGDGIFNVWETDQDNNLKEVTPD